MQEGIYSKDGKYFGKSVGKERLSEEVVLHLHIGSPFDQKMQSNTRPHSVGITIHQLQVVDLTHVTPLPQFDHEGSETFLVEVTPKVVD